jgi:hypothetical protein
VSMTMLYISLLDDDSLDVALAVHCGWERCRDKDGLRGSQYWARFENGHFKTDTVETNGLPRFCHDHNAIYDGEEILLRQDKPLAWSTYNGARINMYRQGAAFSKLEGSPAHLPARQCAEALLYAFEQAKDYEQQ